MRSPRPMTTPRGVEGADRTAGERGTERSPLGPLWYLVAVYIVAGLGGLAVSQGIPGWYANARQPSFGPPNWIFSIAWILLYTVIGIAAWLVSERRPEAPERVSRALRLWWVQLILSGVFTPFFFLFHWMTISMVIITLLDVAIVATMVRFAGVRRQATWLMVPWLLWILFVTALAAEFTRLNA
ncbi:tryptophan-rich sensory protein [Pseudonocardiaceae bacterium YIM PH 21723]|nr:tryptophan-rich sensory protein [Pseudonocardiaceae bacterium YIM PH 21723]